MYPESSPLIITRKLKMRLGGEINSHYELGKMMHNWHTTSVHEVRQLFHPFRPEDNGKQFLVRITQIQETEEAHLQQSRNIMRQYSLLKSLNQLHPKQHFLQQQAAWQDQKHFYQLFQHCCFGSLEQLLEYHIKEKRPFKALHLLYFVREILKMLSVLHQNKMAHGNVKGVNLWLDGRMNVKLGGFDSASKERQSKRGLRCNIYQLPPEAIACRQQSTKSDIWMLGILTFRMYQLRFPFLADEKHNHLSISDRQNVILNRIKSPQPISFDLSLGEPFQADLRDLIKQMLHKTFELRPAAASLMAHKVFKTIGQDSASIRRQIIKDHRMYLIAKKYQMTQWRYNAITVTNSQINLKWQEVSRIRIVEAFRIKDYGFFFRLSDNSIAAYFNDHGILKFNDEQQLNKSKYQARQYQRIKIMRYVNQNYFKHNLKQQLLDQYAFQQGQVQDTSISKLFWHENTLFVRLTNQTIQVFASTQQNQHKSSNSPDYFDYYLMFNNSPSKPNQIVLQKHDRFFIYNNYQQVKYNSESQSYFNHIDQCIKLILDNSTISKKKCQQGFNHQV